VCDCIGGLPGAATFWEPCGAIRIYPARGERVLIAHDETVSFAMSRGPLRCHTKRWDMNVQNIDGLMRAMELEGTARIDIIRIGKDIQTAGYARRSPSVQQYEELRRAVVHWQRIADDIGKIVGSG
jgi:hypothetical protein